jgi:hypothetical protein
MQQVGKRLKFHQPNATYNSIFLLLYHELFFRKQTIVLISHFDILQDLLFLYNIFSKTFIHLLKTQIQLI